MKLDKMLDITTDHELVEMAQRLEKQAANNYDRLAAEMKRHQNIETAELFTKLAEEERLHEKAITAMGEKIVSSSTKQLWEFPTEMTLHGDAGDPFLLTPYNAICFALFNESKTFDLFTHIAAMTSDEKLRLLAEKFAKEELSHIAALRLARLDANRNLREVRAELGWWEDISTIKSDDDLETILGRMENSTMATYEDAAKRLMLINDAENSRFFNTLAMGAKESLQALNVSQQAPTAYSLKSEETPAAILLACLKYTDQTLDYVIYIAEKTTSDGIYAKASSMIERFTNRLTSIRERLAIQFAG